MDKRLCRRAQASMEYMTVYGWAILVIAVVGVVLWQIGVFDTRPSSVNFSGFSKLKPQAAGTGLSHHELDEEGEFRGTFLNSYGGRVIVSAVRVKNADTGAVICCSHAGAGADCVNPTTLEIGDKTDYSEFVDDAPRISNGDNFIVRVAPCAVPGEAGGPYSIQVELDYNTTTGKYMLAHTDAGIIRGPLE
jgi:hypothetical protein